MLASMHKSSDPLAAEFIRTFRHEHYYGRQLLQRYDNLRETDKRHTVSILLPKCTSAQNKTDFASLYGFRPAHADTFFLSPWEFCQWFTAVPLTPPTAGKHSRSKWTASGKAKRGVKAHGRLRVQPRRNYSCQWLLSISNSGPGLCRRTSGELPARQVTTVPQTLEAHNSNW